MTETVIQMARLLSTEEPDLFLIFSFTEPTVGATTAAETGLYWVGNGSVLGANTG